MSAPKVGALFAGYGGLELAVSQVLDAESAWVSEFDAAPSKILAARFPDAPNLGDVTKVQWDEVEPIHILTGGFPCQDVSTAGMRRGLRDGTRSGLWYEMARAIKTLRPGLVVIENVRGLLSAESDGYVEPCSWCLGEAGDGEPPMRALGTVLADLAELGYDAAWTGLRAADVGAPHGRFRVFVLAWPAADTERGGRERIGSAQFAGTSGHAAGNGAPPALPADLGHERAGASRDGRAGPADGGVGAVSLLPTPLHIEALRMLPTPTTTQRGTDAEAEGRPDAGPNLHNAVHDFGQYAPAIARWEAALGRPAPAPTEPTGKGGAHRLSPRFVEWLMGLPDGWVTDTDTTRNEQLKALGNGVVPQQAAAALRHLLGVRAAALAGQAVAA